MLNCGGEGADVDVLEIEEDRREVGGIMVPPDKSYNCLCFGVVYHLPVAVLCRLSPEMVGISTTLPGMPKSC